jgi:cupin superfamily acireductone dioxygenase involved in methionine salvage
MENENITITISVTEYKELIALKIRAEYEEKIRALEADIKELKENADYWFDQYCKRNRENDALQQVIDDLKERLSFYEPVKEGGEAENG